MIKKILAIIISALLLAINPVNAKPSSFCQRHPTHPSCNPIPSPSPAPTPTQAPSGLVGRSGQGFTLNGQPYRFVGYNIYNANSRNNCWYSLGSGNDLDTILSETPGVDVVRSWYFDGLAKTNGVRDWSVFDHTLSILSAHGARAIFVLDEEWAGCAASSAGIKTRAWYESGYKTNYRSWVQEAITHYKNDPRIFSFELLSEPEAPEDQNFICNEALAAPAMRAWATDMTNLAKSLTSNLVTIGLMGGGQCGAQQTDYQSFFAINGIDACDYHEYWESNTAFPGDEWNGLQTRINQCATLGKPLIISETGTRGSVAGSTQTRASWYQTKLDAWFSAGIDGIQIWNLCRIHDPAYGQCDSNSYDIIEPSDPLLQVVAAY